MPDDFLLLTPGPVPLQPPVTDAMTEPMVSHRSASFAETVATLTADLEWIFTHSTLDGYDTTPPDGGTALVLNGTATLGMEAAVSNLVAPGDRVVALVNGKFGERFARIAERYAAVERVAVPWGEAFDMETVAAAISPTTDLVTMVHNETSTGILNPASGVGRLAAEADARFVLDGVTSIGGDVVCIDDWHVDIAITDAQKALGAPPGISAVYVTDAVTDALDGERGPFYADLPRHLQKAAAAQSPFTSAVPLYRAFAAATAAIREEGMPRRIARHRQQAAAVRAGLEAMGLELFAAVRDVTVHSNTVTAARLPPSLRGEASAPFFDAVAAADVAIAGGQAHLGGEIFRISNMGDHRPAAIERGLAAVADALTTAGVDADADAAVTAAQTVLRP